MSLRGFSLKVVCWAGCVLTIASASAGGDSLANLLFTPGQDQLQLQLASYTHYEDSDDYEGPPIYGGAEVHKASAGSTAPAWFNNSYGQFSQYLYVGHQFNLYRFDDKILHFKLSGGALHGYTTNTRIRCRRRSGTSVRSSIPAVGIDAGRWSFDLVFLVDEAMMFNFGFEILD